MIRIAARTMLTPEGWQEERTVEIGPDGRIAALRSGMENAAHRVGILLPAPGNLHSHAFQRAMAGLTERRGASGRDSFWTWRELMYRFLERLTPEDVEAIAAQAMVEMLEAGFAALGEFHYLHHAPGGAGYDRPAEMAWRIAAAAAETGMGLTLLPVLYTRGGADGRALEGGQLRFGTPVARFGRLWDDAAGACATLPPDTVLGVAPHSLRAVSAEELAFAADLAPAAPVHLHIAEQEAEVREIEAACGTRPVAWLLDNQPPDARWCLIHATHMTPAETEAVARSGAVAGLCPITEANLGDGIFDGARYLAAGGRLGIGSDSNVLIGLAEELRTLEYSQRLGARRRAVMAAEGGSVGRCLFDAVCAGGAQALGRDGGRIEAGRLADLVALDDAALALAGQAGDGLLDAWIFAAREPLVTDVWSAGRHVVSAGRHKARGPVEARFRATIARLGAAL